MMDEEEPPTIIIQKHPANQHEAESSSHGYNHRRRQRPLAVAAAACMLFTLSVMGSIAYLRHTNSHTNGGGSVSLNNNARTKNEHDNNNSGKAMRSAVAGGHHHHRVVVAPSPQRQRQPRRVQNRPNKRSITNDNNNEEMSTMTTTATTTAADNAGETTEEAVGEMLLGDNNIANYSTADGNIENDEGVMPMIATLPAMTTTTPKDDEPHNGILGDVMVGSIDSGIVGSTTEPMPIIATDPVDQFINDDDASLTTTTTSATTEPPPFHTDPIDQFEIVASMPTITTTVATTTPAATEEDKAAVDNFVTDNSSSASSTTTGATTTTTEDTIIPSRPAYWYPMEPPTNKDSNNSNSSNDGGYANEEEDRRPTCIYGTNYPSSYNHPSFMNVTLFQSEDDCCTAYYACGDNDTATATTDDSTTMATTTDNNNTAATDIITTTTSTTKSSPYWYPSLTNDNYPACICDSSYPPEYTLHSDIIPMLFTTQLECCDAFPEACVHYLWYPTLPPNNNNNNNDGSHRGMDGGTTITTTTTVVECTFGEDYLNIEGFNIDYLYLTKEECCNVWCSSGSGTNDDSDAENDDSDVAEEATAMEDTEIGVGDGVASISTTTMATTEAPTTTTEVVSQTTAATPVITATTEVTGEEAATTTTEVSDPTTIMASTTTTTTTTEATTSSTNPNEKEEEIDSCLECKWHESITEVATCTNSPEYPAAWDDVPHVHRQYFFYGTSDECCSMRFPNGCAVVDVDLLEDAGEGAVDGGYGSEEVVVFGGGTTDNANAVDYAGENNAQEVQVSEFTLLGSSTKDDFEGSTFILPFNLGSPFDPQWKLTSDEAYSGRYSLTNVLPSESTTTATSSLSSTMGSASSSNNNADLTLKIQIANPSTITCQMKISTSMPFDYFTLFVNDEQRNTYHTKLDDNWMPLVTGLNGGENTIVFRVVQNVDENGEVDQNVKYILESLGGSRMEEQFGNGHVYLDDCMVVDYS